MQNFWSSFEYIWLKIKIFSFRHSPYSLEGNFCANVLVTLDDNLSKSFAMMHELFPLSFLSLTSYCYENVI
jgi:hypothetical protein